MKKLLFVLMALLAAAPAMAVQIKATDEGSGVVRIDYIRTASEQRARAFGIDLSITSGNAVFSSIVAGSFKTGESSASNPAFGIFPGRITITSSGTVTDYGNPQAVPGSAGYNASGITLELGSLYKGDANSPAPGTAAATVQLCKIKYTGSTDSFVTITANATRGGVVFEDANAVPSPTLTGTTIVFAPPSECVKTSAPFYSDWSAFGKPSCWCFPRNCKGDADGGAQGAAKTGYYYVGTNDLNVLMAAWQIKQPPYGSGINSKSYGSVQYVCSDFSHSAQGAAKTGYYRVGTDDLNALMSNWQIKQAPYGSGVAPCDSTNYNFLY